MGATKNQKCDLTATVLTTIELFSCELQYISQTKNGTMADESKQPPQNSDGEKSAVPDLPQRRIDVESSGYVPKPTHQDEDGNKVHTSISEKWKVYDSEPVPWTDEERRVSTLHDNILRPAQHSLCRSQNVTPNAPCVPHAFFCSRLTQNPCPSTHYSWTRKTSTTLK